MSTSSTNPFIITKKRARETDKKWKRFVVVPNRRGEPIMISLQDLETWEIETINEALGILNQYKTGSLTKRILRKKK